MEDTTSVVEYRRYILANERPDKEVSLTRDQRREAGYKEVPAARRLLRGLV